MENSEKALDNYIQEKNGIGIQELKKSALIIIGADLMHLVTSTARFISSGNSI